MKYICTVISVSDIEAAKKFYKDLFGLKIYQDYGKNIAFTCGLALQQDFDWLVGIAKENIGKKSNNVEIVFEEDDFDKFVEKLGEFNIEYVHPVKEHSWGQRVVRFYDPDKHIIEIGENMKAVCKRFLDSGMTPEQAARRMDVPMKFVSACMR